MNPVNFEQANKHLGPPRREYSERVEGIDPLPIYTDGEQCISCWKMSWKERLSALFFGAVWLQVLSGETQHPVSLHAMKVFFTEKKR